MRAIATIAALAFVLVGCDSSGAEPEQQEEPAAYGQECGSALEDAAAVGDMEDTVEDTDPAIVACASVEAFTAASADHPDALDDTDVETWLSNRCQYSEDPAVRSSAICAEVRG